MACKSLHTGITIRVLLLTAAITGTVLYNVHDFHIIPAIAGSLITILLVMELIQFLNNSYRLINTFIESIANDDTTFNINIEKHYSKPLSYLVNSIRKLSRSYSQAKTELEAREKFFSILAENTPAGILVIDSQSKVQVANSWIKTFTGIDQIHSLNQIERHSPGLFNQIKNPQVKKTSKATVKNSSGDIVYISMSSVNLKILNEKLKLIVIQDISDEMERQEVESWQKLLRILNHEIMNSIAPVASISETLRDHLTVENKKEAPVSLTDDDIKKITGGLEVIHSNSRSLIGFANSFRNLTGLPTPQIKPTPVKDMFNRISILSRSSSGNTRILLMPSLTFKITPGDLKINMDEELITRVIWNLVKNSMESFQDREDALINLEAGKDRDNNPYIKVTDNGNGIPDEIRDRVFLPFFTTKEGGTGIGLSLSKQIVNLHNGRLSFTSENEKGTSFLLTFRQ